MQGTPGSGTEPIGDRLRVRIVDGQTVRTTQRHHHDRRPFSEEPPQRATLVERKPPAARSARWPRRATSFFAHCLPRRSPVGSLPFVPAVASTKPAVGAVCAVVESQSVGQVDRLALAGLHGRGVKRGSARFHG